MITDRQLNGICSEIATARERWLTFWLERLLPPVCIRWVKERKNLEAVSRYCERKKIRTIRQEGQPREMLVQGDQLIATFEIKTTRL